jgi:hypothetical protein
MTLHRWTRAAMYDANASGNIRLPPPIEIGVFSTKTESMK